MFPSYWNGVLYSAPFTVDAIGILSHKRDDNNLPDEIKEALEIHKNEYHSEKEKEEFIHKMYLKQ